MPLVRLVKGLSVRDILLGCDYGCDLPLAWRSPRASRVSSIVKRLLLDGNHGERLTGEGILHVTTNQFELGQGLYMYQGRKV